MGNPAISPQQAGPAKRVPTDHNGILAWVPAESRAAAEKHLPAAKAGVQEQHQVVVQVPSIGPVRITFRLNTYKHGRNRFWHWLAVWAEEVTESEGTP